MAESLLDRIIGANAQLYRKAVDLNVDFLGTRTSILRVTATTENLIGDTALTYSSQAISNVIINYPFSKVDALTTNDQSSTDIHAISITDLLPIQMIIPSSAFGTEENEIDRNDIIVDYIKTTKGKKFYLVMTGARLVSTIMSKHEIIRKYELTLLRGVLETAIQAQIDSYIASLDIPEVISTYPIESSATFRTTDSIQLLFNTNIKIMGLKDAISCVYIEYDLNNNDYFNNYYGDYFDGYFGGLDSEDFFPLSFSQQLSLNTQSLDFSHYENYSGILINTSGILNPGAYTLTLADNVPISESNFSLAGDFTLNFIVV